MGKNDIQPYSVLKSFILDSNESNYKLFYFL